MKPSVLVLAAATAAATVAAQDAAVNGTESSSPTPSAASTSHAHVEASYTICDPPDSKLSPWYYNTYAYSVRGCTVVDDTRAWGMMRAYRAGGVQNVHWKYTDDANDGACMTNWIYYSSDGQTNMGQIGRTTFQGDSRRWCALPVYRQGGVKGKQWDHCSCSKTPGIPGR